MTPEVNLTFNKRKLAVKFKLQSSENIAERGGGGSGIEIDFFLQLLQYKRCLRVGICECFIS